MENAYAFFSSWGKNYFLTNLEKFINLVQNIYVNYMRMKKEYKKKNGVFTH